MNQIAYYPSLFSYELHIWKRQPGRKWTGLCVVLYNGEEVDREGWEHANTDVLYGMAHAHFLAVRAMYTAPGMPGSFKVEGSDDVQLPLIDESVNSDEP